MDNELKSFRALLPASHIECCTKQLVQAILRFNDYRKLKLRFQFPEAYPNEPLLLELSSDTLPSQIIKRLTNQSDKKALELSKNGERQMVIITETILQVLRGNKFLYAFDEIKQIKAAISAPCTVKMNESKGTLRFHLEKEAYQLDVSMKVEDSYPDCGVEITPIKSNFHPHLLDLHIYQAREISRRCVMGYTSEQALLASNPMPPPPKDKTGRKSEVRLTNAHVNSLRNDVKFLKRATELREVNSKRADGRSGFANSTTTRKNARRELKSLSKEEMAKEAEQEQMNKLMDDMEAMQTAGYSNTNPTKSILTVFKFLWNNFVVRLASEPCQACQKPALPTNPKKAITDIDSKNPKRVERVYCGHWYHWECLNEWMLNPPFGKNCPGCDRRLYHKDWPTDVKQLERAWANRKTKERELNEVGDCFDLDDQFRVQ